AQASTKPAPPDATGTTAPAAAGAIPGAQPAADAIPGAQQAADAVTQSEPALSQASDALQQAGPALSQASDSLQQAAAGGLPPPMPTVPADMGFLHFVAQSDFVGKTLFIILVIMSLVTWYLILVKCASNVRMRRRSREFLNKFWNSSSLEQVENEIVTHGARDPFS